MMREPISILLMLGFLALGAAMSIKVYGDRQDCTRAGGVPLTDHFYTTVCFPGERQPTAAVRVPESR